MKTRNIKIIIALIVTALVFAGLLYEQNWWGVWFHAAFLWVLWDYRRYRQYMSSYAAYYRELENLHSDEMYRLVMAMYYFSSWDPERGYCICGQDEHTKNCQLFRKTLQEHQSVLDKINAILEKYSPFGREK